MNRFLEFILGFLHAQDGDGFLLIWAKEILGALLILALFWLLSHLAVMMLNKWGRRLTAFTSTDLDDRVLQQVIPYVSRLFLVLGVYLAIRSLPLNEKLVMIASGIIYIILVVIVCNLIYHVLGELLKWYISGRQGDTAGAVMSRQMVPVAEKIVSLLLMGAALIVILKHFSYDIFSLVTALGIGSLAIGMAAKDTLAHMISGFTIMLDRPFRIGDRIQLVGGQIGDVADIGLRSTKIKTPDNQLLIIPNSGRINIGVAYGSDVDLVKQLLIATAGEVEDVLADPAPEAYFASFGDSALNMALFFWVEEYGTLFAVTDKINSLILKRFGEHSIEIPFPTRTVKIQKGLN